MKSLRAAYASTAMTAAFVVCVNGATVFSTTFDYAADPLLGSADSASDLNGATGQIGTWGGTASLPDAIGGDLSGNHVIGIQSSSGNDYLLVDRPSSDIELSTLFTNAIALDGTGSYSFDWQFRRVLSSPGRKDIDVVGYDDSDTELFHLRLASDQNGSNFMRIGVVESGGSVTWDLGAGEGAGGCRLWQ